MKQFLFVFGIFLLFFSCKEQDNFLEQNTESLISYIINVKAYPLPPLPPLPSDTISSWKISAKVIDSLRDLKLRVGVYPILEKPILNNILNLEGVDIEFTDLIENFNIIEVNNNINIEKINANSRHVITVADTLVLKKSKNWKDYDLLFRFSNISFNDSFNKAALRLGIGRSSLGGSGGLYLFKKDNTNNWQMVKYYQLEEWEY
ncbi:MULTISPECIES: hypothetical protein [unclassified Lacinutrix]